MKRHSFFLTIAAGLLVAGIGALDARAGSVPLPTTLDKLIGNSTTVVGAEALTFSGFTYSAISVPAGYAPAASSIGVGSFTLGKETGFTLSGTLSALPPSTLVDLTITYVVTAPVGQLINDAVLITTGGNFGGTGYYGVDETLVNANNPTQLVGTLSASNLSSPVASASFAGVNSIYVTKDIFLSTGSLGVSLSAITEGFSSTSVPEPASMALLGIGMTSFLAFRRFFKRTMVA